MTDDYDPDDLNEQWEGNDVEEPATHGTQTRSLGWTGYQLTVRELRGWLNPLPDHATLTVFGINGDPRRTIEATWEVAP